MNTSPICLQRLGVLNGSEVKQIVQTTSDDLFMYPCK
jgi:hypothetical protein